MKAYHEGKSLIIQNENKVYVIWCIEDVLTIDLYSVLNEKIINCQVILGDPHWEESIDDGRKVLKEMREGKLKEVSLKQYLTHPKEEVRELIKELIK